MPTIPILASSKYESAKKMEYPYIVRDYPKEITLNYPELTTILSKKKKFTPIPHNSQMNLSIINPCDQCNPWEIKRPPCEPMSNQTLSYEQSLLRERLRHYLLCYNATCPRKDTWLHWFVDQWASDDTLYATVINLHWCKFFVCVVNMKYTYYKLQQNQQL